MAVEILILSGARRDERVVLDSTSFRAGANPDCEVYFHPQDDTSAVNRTASFRLMEDGWYIVQTTGNIHINQRAVTGPARIRSGDVVRMSETGPDFSFNIVSSAAAQRMKSSIEATKSTTVSGPLRDLSSNVDMPLKSPVTTDQIGPATPLPISTPPPISAHQEVSMPSSAALSATVAPAPASIPAPPSVVLSSNQQNTPKTATKERWLFYVVCGLAVCVVVVLLMRGNTPTTVQVTLNTPLVNGEKSSKVVQEDKKTSPPVEQTSKPSQPSQPSPPTTEERIAAQIKDAVFLIQVETAGRFWPFATCCAIGKNTLLTRAWTACKISEWRKDPQKKFKIWITNPAGGVKMAVQDIYINTLLTTLENNLDDWKYYDLALLTVTEELPKIIPLASVDEVSKLKEGLPVFCFGFTHDGEKITDFDSFQPQLMREKIYIITALPNVPSHPKLLQIKEKFLKNTFGSPIVNEQGKIVAIYGDVMQPQSNAEKSLGEIHYATVLNPELINLGLNREYGKIWISTDLYQIVSKSKDEK